MSAVIDVPQRFDDWSFEQFAAAFAKADGAAKVIVDAHACEWISPLGLVGLLAAGQALHERTGIDIPDADYAQLRTLNGTIDYLGRPRASASRQPR